MLERRIGEEANPRHFDLVDGRAQIVLSDIVYDPHRLALWASQGDALPTLAASLLFSEYVKAFLKGLHEDVGDALQMKLPGFHSATPEAYAEEHGTPELMAALAEAADEPVRKATIEQCAEDLLRLLREINIEDATHLARFSGVMARRLGILRRAADEEADREDRAADLFSAADYLEEELANIDALAGRSWHLTIDEWTYRVSQSREVQVRRRSIAMKVEGPPHRATEPLGPVALPAQKLWGLGKD